MKRNKRQYFIWTGIAGALFLVVGIHDLVTFGSAGKSVFVIVLELVAGLGSCLNAILGLRKFR